jgi:hypothetical protein
MGTAAGIDGRATEEMTDRHPRNGWFVRRSRCEGTDEHRGSTRPRYSTETTDVLVRVGLAAVPALCGALRSSTEIVCARAAKALGRIGPAAKDAVGLVRPHRRQ